MHTSSNKRNKRQTTVVADLPAKSACGTSYKIVRALGDERKEAADYLAREHYMQSCGGSGMLFAAHAQNQTVAGAVLIGATASQRCDESIVKGACLIGPTASKDAETSIASSGILIRQIKRSHLRDGVDVLDLCESQLLRIAMQSATDEYDEPVLFVSYADPAATDERNGMPLLGWTYLAAGFFYIGQTTGKRWCVIDHLNRARSTRQGGITLTRKTLPKAGETFHGELVTRNWTMKTLPPARVWIAICTPSRFSKKQAKRAVLTTWRNLNPARRVAAKRWIDHVDWQRKLNGGIVALGDPKPSQMLEYQRFQPAWWDGADVTRTAAPVWVPFLWQHELVLEDSVVGERTAQRRYKPLTHDQP